MDFLDDISNALAPVAKQDNAESRPLISGLSILGFTFGGSSSILSKVSLRLENDGATQPLPVSDLPQFELENTQPQDAPRPDDPRNALQLAYPAEFNDILKDTNPNEVPLPISKLSLHLESPSKPIASQLFMPTQVIRREDEAIRIDSGVTQVIPSDITKDLHQQSTQVIAKSTDATMLDTTQTIVSNTPTDLPNPSRSIANEDGTDMFSQNQVTSLPLPTRTQVLSQLHELEMDISNTTLTDDEQDLNPSTFVSSHDREIVTKKELEQEELLLNVEKRRANIRPDFNKKLVFSKQALLDAFDDHQVVDDETVAPSSPPTSPLKEPVVGSKISTPGPSLRNPLDLYAQKLRQQLLSSPTGGEQGGQLIDLDSSDNEVSIFSSPLNRTVSKPHKHVVEDIPALTKEQKLAIKQRFSKRKQQAPGRPSTTKKNGWITALRKANAQQLKAREIADPNHAAKEELEKEEEIMGSLLEREMERVRNIRKQEKMRERAAQALLNRDDSAHASDVDRVPESDDVPDSEYSSSGESAGEQELDADDSANEISAKPKRSQVAVLADSESDEELSGSEQVVKYSAKSLIPDNPSEEDVSPVCLRKDSYQLFQNLPARTESQFQSQGTQPSYIGTNEPMVLPEFEDLSDQDIPATPHDTQATQVDSASVPAVFLETQVISKVTNAAIVSKATEPTQSDDDLDEEETAINPTSVREGLEQLIKSQPVMPNDSDDSEQEELAEAIQERIKFYEAKIRRKELAARKRRKQMEQRGFKNMVDGEAEESEDEWHGLGGADGEVSDQANSEDERMIDNNMGIDINDAEVRKKFMEQYQIKDQQELEKLLDDVKNHRLTKRVGVQGLNIELSDEEDELLAAYRRQKWQEQQERLQKTKNMTSLAKNQRVKAFFDSIEETGPLITLDEEMNEESEVLENEEPALEEGVAVKKTIKLKESFVQKQLSFLTLGTFEETYENIQKTARAQDADSTDEDENDNWRALKTKSMSRLAVGKATILVHESHKRAHQDTDEDSDESLPSLFKKPSIVKSFKSFKEQEGVQIRDGKQFSGVTSHKEYRVALGSNASIARLTRNTVSLR